MSAVARSRLYRRALSMKIAARDANSIPISASYASKARNPLRRVHTMKPSVIPRAFSGSSSMDVPDSSFATGPRSHESAILSMSLEVMVC